MLDYSHLINQIKTDPDSLTVCAEKNQKATLVTLYPECGKLHTDHCAKQFHFPEQHEKVTTILQLKKKKKIIDVAAIFQGTA